MSITDWDDEKGQVKEILSPMDTLRFIRKELNLSYVTLKTKAVYFISASKFLLPLKYEFYISVFFRANHGSEPWLTQHQIKFLHYWFCKRVFQSFLEFAIFLYPTLSIRIEIFLLQILPTSYFTYCIPIWRYSCKSSRQFLWRLQHVGVFTASDPMPRSDNGVWTKCNSAHTQWYWIPAPGCPDVRYHVREHWRRAK